ncbi:MAG: competence/damage-inducible protein A [Bacillota bacterium]|jgi:nicotinamide-nucleotide amidase
MKAEIISVGTELLLGQTVDTNAAYIARYLAELGFSVYRKTTVGDNRARLASAVREALERADVVVTTGGLGPTEDDLTRETVAEVLGVRLVENPEVLAYIKGYFTSRGARMTENNTKQALVPGYGAGSYFPNTMGTAPGLTFEAGDKRVICLPGVPREMIYLMETHVEPYLRAYLTRSGAREAIVSRIIRTVGIGEAALEERIFDLSHDQANPTVAIYAEAGECQIRVTASAEEEAEAWRLIDSVEREIRTRLGSVVYGYDADTLEVVVARRLAAAGASLAVTESCTGGLICGLLTDVAGSSVFLERGIVAYSNSAKRDELSVRGSTLDAHGAVSRETAIEMACGVVRKADANLGLSVTGIAGPSGGSPDKPVGLVYFGLADAKKVSVISARMRFGGDRRFVRMRASKFGLDLLRRRLEDAWA